LVHYTVKRRLIFTPLLAHPTPEVGNSRRMVKLEVLCGINILVGADIDFPAFNLR
jgi:hypothetical protein